MFAGPHHGAHRGVSSSECRVLQCEGALYPEPANGAYNAIKEARLRKIERSATPYAWAQVSSSLDVFGQDLFSIELRWRFETLCLGAGLESIKNLLFHRGRLRP